MTRRARTLRTLAAALSVAAALTLGCSGTARHKVLNFFFDGVPMPQPPVVTATEAGAETAGGAPLGRTFASEHGPYGAKLCGACHDAQAVNALVVSGDRLCARCHDLALDKQYVHGPVADGGCLSCHDPHSSPYRHLLLSESDGFCLHCHDGAALSPVEGHAAGETNCTSCHDAHMSDRKFLLKAGRG